jgi:hypothetical protein
MKGRAGLGHYDLRITGGNGESLFEIVARNTPLDKPVLANTPLKKRRSLDWLPGLSDDDEPDDQDDDDEPQSVQCTMAFEATVNLDEADAEVYSGLHRYLGEIISVELESRRALEAELEQLVVHHHIRDLLVVREWSTPNDTLRNFRDRVLDRREFNTSVVRAFYEQARLWRDLGDLRRDLDMDSHIAVFAENPLSVIVARLHFRGFRFTCVEEGPDAEAAGPEHSEAAAAG